MPYGFMKNFFITILFTCLVFSIQQNLYSSRVSGINLETAIDKIYKNNYKGALKELNEIIKEDCRNPEVYYFRAVAFLCLNKNQEAIKDLSVAIALHHKTAKYYYLRAMAYAEQDDLLLAYRDMVSAIEIEENDADYYLLRAQIEIALNYMMDAVQDLEKAAELGSLKAKDLLKKHNS
jgi:Tfp pilus assembly protein PilF